MALKYNNLTLSQGITVTNPYIKIINININHNILSFSTALYNSEQDRLSNKDYFEGSNYTTDNFDPNIPAHSQAYNYLKSEYYNSAEDC